MYSMLLLVALASCAHAAVPEYRAALSNYDVSVKELLPHLNFKEPNQTQVNYLMLDVAVSLLARLEFRGEVVDYDEVVRYAVLLAKRNPKQERDRANRRYKRAQRKSAKLRKVVQDLCLTPRGSAGSAACDADVDAAVKKDRELQKESPFLLALSDVGAAYYKLRNELNDVARSEASVKQYFRTAKVKVKYLAHLLANVYKLLEGPWTNN